MATTTRARTPDLGPIENPKQLIRESYNKLTYVYRQDDEEGVFYNQWHDRFTAMIPAGGSIVDAGCGCGVPTSRSLANAGYSITGIDISEAQIKRARELVPSGTFHLADMAEFDPEGFGPFDAVFCLFAIFHLPVSEHKAVIEKFARWVKGGGFVFIIVGESRFEGGYENWLGGGAPMWWSHSDKSTYEGWFEEVGLDIVERVWIAQYGKFEEDGSGGSDNGFPFYVLKKGGI